MKSLGYTEKELSEVFAFQSFGSESEVLHRVSVYHCVVTSASTVYVKVYWDRTGNFTNLPLVRSGPVRWKKCTGTGSVRSCLVQGTGCGPVLTLFVIWWFAFLCPSF